ncbi:39S ribosomal protein L52, mitochondrial [Tribolium madens]|uniref:39S ribosomal protein L52, mitochondrial n=1 Tax=Tribolium madens TaxID=41895 RepID=UPI001CF7241B|nr:39S ribosomal protein L52, mitochondrial [Tribolium madens]
MWLQFNNVLLLTSRRCFGTTQTIHLNQKWRQQRGLPLNPNSCGVLTDGPDYSFLDGRPTPYGVGQKKRIMKNQELTEQIIKLAGEIDFAVERHNKLTQEENNRKQKILDNKLKPKGVELLKKKK